MSANRFAGRPSALALGLAVWITSAIGSTTAVTTGSTAGSSSGSIAGSTTGAGAPPAAVTEDDMQGEIAALARASGEARHTVIRVDWERRLVGAAEARAAAEAVVRAGFAPGDAEIDQKVFQRLGLLAAGASYLDVVADAVAREPTGFYDPAARRLYVPRFIPLVDQRATLAHEIAHAFQDQRFGLRRFLGMASDGRRGLSFDGLLARQAVIEGDATVMAIEAIDPKGTFPAPYQLAALAQQTRDAAAGGLAAGPGDRTPRTPRFLREILGFPYSEGFAFVARVRATAPWSAVDALWARPPGSTAQILHPETYDRREGSPTFEPPALPALPLLADRFRLARTDTLGELLLRVWLSSPAIGAAIQPDVCQRAAAGWRGDRVAVYLPVLPTIPLTVLPDKTGSERLASGRDGGAGVGPAVPVSVSAPGSAVGASVTVVNVPSEPAPRGAALVWLTWWDSDADADDFLQTVAPRLAALASEDAGPVAGAGTGPGAPPSSLDGIARPAVWRARATDSVFAVQRRAASVALLLGAPEAALPSLATLLDAAAPRREPPARRNRREIR